MKEHTMTHPTAFNPVRQPDKSFLVEVDAQVKETKTTTHTRLTKSDGTLLKKPVTSTTTEDVVVTRRVPVLIKRRKTLRKWLGKKS